MVQSTSKAILSGGHLPRGVDPMVNSSNFMAIYSSFNLLDYQSPCLRVCMGGTALHIVIIEWSFQHQLAVGIST